MTTEQIINTARWSAFIAMWRDIGKSIALPYTVTLWGSHPDENNDDAWTGGDYATRDEAIAAYRAVCMFPEDGLAEHLACGGWAFVEIDGPDVHEVSKNPDQASVRKHRRQMERDDRDWQRERANEAGMLHGIDAYNDEMGW